MFNCQGKYNTARVMLQDKGNLDATTAEQINGFLNNSTFSGGQIVIMPDCHAGAGSCIGFTMTLTGKVIPNIVGVDIGCGMLAYKLPIDNVDFQSFDDHVRDTIPYGFKIHEDNVENMKWLTSEEAVDFVEMANRVGQKEGKAIESLGSLGGGNHFIEIDRNDEGEYWLVIHSGSRNLGLQVAKYHQGVAKSLGNEGGQKGLEYLTGEEKDVYLADMQLGQRYASLNRLFMMRRLLAFFNIYGIDLEDCIECVHNYISFRDNIVRKGAISAHIDEDVIIPLNMRDGVIFGKGKGNVDWNYSAPHGAGRILSRTKAKSQLTVEEYKKEMDGIWSSCISKKTLDESPMAYKDMDVIMASIGETIEVSFVAKPIYNFKAN